MTAVEWFAEKLQYTMYVEYGYVNGVRKVVIPLEDYMELKKDALQMEKQQIIDAHKNGEYLISNIENAEQYYTSTYGSKGSETKQ